MLKLKSVCSLPETVDRVPPLALAVAQGYAKASQILRQAQYDDSQNSYNSLIGINFIII